MTIGPEGHVPGAASGSLGAPPGNLRETALGQNPASEHEGPDREGPDREGPDHEGASMTTIRRRPDRPARGRA